jgi:hypothetical protein
MRKVMAAAALAVTLAGLPAFAQLDPSGEWAPRFHEDQLERIPGPDPPTFACGRKWTRPLSS